MNLVEHTQQEENNLLHMYTGGSGVHMFNEDKERKA